MRTKILSILVIMLVIAGFLTYLSSSGAVKSNGDSGNLNPADTAWVSVAAALVMLMTPALGFFYGGLVRQKNIVSTIMQCLIIFAISTGVWSLIG